MNDKDIVSLFAMFCIFLVFLYFGKSFLENVAIMENPIINELNNNIFYKEFFQNKSEENKLSDKSFNTYDNTCIINNEGFVNELLPKSNKICHEDLNNQFKNIKENIPIDNNLCYRGFKPKSKENKTDMPLPNVPLSYLLDTNKSIKLSEEIKKNIY